MNDKATVISVRRDQRMCEIVVVTTQKQWDRRKKKLVDRATSRTMHVPWDKTLEQPRFDLAMPRTATVEGGTK